MSLLAQEFISFFLSDVKIVFGGEMESKEVSFIFLVILELLFVSSEFVFESVFLGQEVGDTEETQGGPELTNMNFLVFKKTLIVCVLRAHQNDGADS